MSSIATFFSMSWTLDNMLKNTGDGSNVNEEKRKKVLKLFEQSNLSLNDLSVADLANILHSKLTGTAQTSDYSFENEEKRKKALKLFEQSNLSLIDLSVVDLVDALHYKLAERGYKSIRYPPTHIRRMVQDNDSVFGYGATGAQFAAYLKLLTGLKPHHNVLDIGCGGGRIASFLAHYLKAPGSFYGLDVVPELIEYSKKIVPSPLFHFKHLNIYSKNYNPDPAAPKPEEFKLPYHDDFFDTVYLVSVFTHMIPPIANYVKQISRVMKNNAKCLISFFLLQNNPQYLKGSWKEKHKISDLAQISDNVDKKYFRSGNVKNPEQWVIYDLDYIKSLFEENKLQLVDGPYFGHWNNYPEWLSHQDILIFKKV